MYRSSNSQKENKGDWVSVNTERGSMDGWHYYQGKKSNKTGWDPMKMGYWYFNSSFNAKGNKDNSLVS